MLHFELADIIKSDELRMCTNDMERPCRLYEWCVARISRCVFSPFLLTGTLRDVVELSSIEPFAY